MKKRKFLAVTIATLGGAVLCAAFPAQSRALGGRFCRFGARQSAARAYRTSWRATACAPCDSVQSYNETGASQCQEGYSALTAPPAPCDPVADSYWEEYCPGAPQEVAAARDELLAAVNQTRAAYGLASLKFDGKLEQGAARQVRICARQGCLIHTRAAVAEILAQSSGINGAIRQWLQSAPHRAALLSQSYTRAGVAVYQEGGRVWCAIQFY